MSRYTRLCVLAISALLALLALSLAGCETTDTLDGTSWKLTGWSVSAINPADFAITASFSNGRIGGNGGVNSYGGPYAIGADSSLTIGTITSTLMAGSDEANAAESAYFALLDQVRYAEISGDTLLLTDGNGNELLIYARQ